MRTKAATWFECKIRYDKTMEDGTQKKVTEQYVVDALSFEEAERLIVEEMSAFISGEFDIKDIKIASYREVFFSDYNIEDRWYKAKVAFISVDEKTQKEKRTNYVYLVNAASFNGAVSAVDRVMGATMIDYVIVAMSETRTMDVLEYKSKDAGNGTEDKTA